jgi:FkbM family methyltransferase
VTKRLIVRAARRARQHLGGGRGVTQLERLADLVWIQPDVAGAEPFHVLRVRGSDQVALMAATSGWASFEQPLPVVITALVDRFCRGRLVADVGANSGYYSLLVTAVDPRVRVDAFEPYPPVTAILRRNLAINAADRITVRTAALGEMSGRATLYVPNDTHGLVETSSSLNPDFTMLGVGSQVSVTVTTLDDVYPEGGAQPALLKIDVESLEAEVLRGGASLLRNARPLVIVEVLPHADPAPLETLRSALGYVDVRLHPTGTIVGPEVVPDAEGWNHLWVPDDRLDEVLQCLEAAGLPSAT